MAVEIFNFRLSQFLGIGSRVTRGAACPRSQGSYLVCAPPHRRRAWTTSHRSGCIAEKLGRKLTALAPTRSQLVQRDDLKPEPRHTALAVPLFDELMRRIMPDATWRE